MALQKASKINFVFWWTVHRHTEWVPDGWGDCNTSVRSEFTKLAVQSCVGKTSPCMTGRTPSSYRVKMLLLMTIPCNANIIFCFCHQPWIFIIFVKQFDWIFNLFWQALATFRFSKCQNPLLPSQLTSFTNHVLWHWNTRQHVPSANQEPLYEFVVFDLFSMNCHLVCP